MPYNRLSNLPTTARNHRPRRNQENYRAAFSSACDQYGQPAARRDTRSQEEAAYAVANKKEVRPCRMAILNIRGWMH
jgi:cation transport regulator